MTRFASVVLIINSVVMGLIGLAYLYDPDLLLGNYGLTASDPSMDNMLRASYGGVSLVLAALWGWGGVKAHRRLDMLALLSLVMGGFALGRIASLIQAGPPQETIYSLLGYEIVVCILSLFLLIKIRQKLENT
ncbi:DUF4345 domain-containing protein [Kordiimonas sp. SCSIO 12610]|uniref:DUF4345 domain-containing protein n=1 Tax=Kordiimonas sp. SCSIO 12610 TaxID=2829597 RepID=UPI00210B8E01|nr:DUF4345 domain-containing protein [Kordiimonas sp. SCSIO 12610]UTW55421.1 DUF4345 domain-containing protein [Kordiimonas sp. SCSIO 12610]